MRWAIDWSPGHEKWMKTKTLVVVVAVVQEITNPCLLGALNLERPPALRKLYVSCIHVLYEP